MSQYDAPNQEVVRPDGSPPWEEGEGGSTQPQSEPEAEGEASSSSSSSSDLDAMTKDELLAEAQRLGVTPANAGMTKEELRAGIEAAS